MNTFCFKLVGKNLLLVFVLSDNKLMQFEKMKYILQA